MLTLTLFNRLTLITTAFFNKQSLTLGPQALPLTTMLNSGVLVQAASLKLPAAMLSSGRQRTSMPTSRGRSQSPTLTKLRATTPSPLPSGRSMLSGAKLRHLASLKIRILRPTTLGQTSQNWPPVTNWLTTLRYLKLKTETIMMPSMVD